SAGEIEERARTAEQEFAALEATVLDVEEGEEDLDQEYEKAEAARAAAAAEVESWQEELRGAEAERARLQARCEALELSLRRKDGAAALLADEETRGVVGTLSSLVAVAEGHEAAVAAALGWAGEALVVEDLASATAAVERLRATDQGRAGLLVSRAAPAHDPSALPDLPEGARWAGDVGPPRSAVELVEREQLVAVTPEGDVYGPGWVRGGSAAAPSLIELQAALDAAREEQRAAGARAEQARFELAAARERLTEHTATAEAALERLHDSDARMAAVAEKLGQLGAAMRAAAAEKERTEKAIAAAEQALAEGRGELEQLEQRLAAAQEEQPEEAEPSTEERDRLAAAAAAARTRETEVRLALRTHEERVRALAGRAESPEAAVRDEIAARERAAARRERRRREAAVAAAVATAASYLLGELRTMLTGAAHEREQAQAEQVERDTRLREARARAGELADQLRELTDSVHKDEVARAEQRLRIEALRTRAVEELGIDPDALVEEYGPHQPIPPLGEDAEGAEPQPF